MQKKIFYFILLAIILILGGVRSEAFEGSPSKSLASASSGGNVSSMTFNSEQRPVLTVTPREIDLGSIKESETVFGEFSLKNISPHHMEWAVVCPEDWESDVKTIRGTVSDTSTLLHIELFIEDSQEYGVLDRQTKAPRYLVKMKMENEGKKMVCQKRLKAGGHRKAIRFSSPGGQRTVFLDFRIHAMQEEPSINLNPQRLDLGLQKQGKIISKKIELNNRGREMLRWSVKTLQADNRDHMQALRKERYFSFQNQELSDKEKKYLVPEHLKDTMEIIGKWTQKNGYPLSSGPANALKFHFQGTGISVFMQSHKDDGNCSIYLDDVILNLQDVLSGEWEKKELIIAEGLSDGPHTMNIVIREGTLEFEGIKIFGKDIMRGPKGWITVFPSSGTTLSETDYINVKADMTNLTPGYYGDQILFKSNVGEEIAEVFVEVVADAGQKVIDVFLYSKDEDYLFTSDPQAETRRLIQNGYIKEGIAFRLFAPQTAGTTNFHRWYNPKIRDHFYHSDRNAGGKKLDGYIYEGTIGNIATSKMTNTRELYRWYNPITKKHYYSTGTKGVSGARKVYVFEGIAGYVR